MQNIIISFFTGVLGPIVVLLIKHYLESRKKTKDPLKEAVNNADIISSELEVIMEDFEADRIWIAQFHNGGHFYPTGKSIQKFSLLFELVRQTKDSIRNSFQNIPVNLFSRFFAGLLKDHFICISDYTDEKIATYGLKYIAQENLTKSSYIFALRSMDDKMIGVLALEYTAGTRNLNADEIIKLRLEAAKIGTILMTQLSQK